MEQITSLKKGQLYITESSQDAYRIESGSVYVYIVPVKAGKSGRRALLGRVTEGRIIPGFAFKDIDYREWRFLLVPIEDVRLTVLSGGTTNPLKRNFAKKYEVANYDKEGFEQGLVDHYEMILAKEDVYFIRTNLEKDAVIDRTEKLIEAVTSENSSIAADMQTDNELYNCVYMLCKLNGITVAPIEDIQKRYGDEFSFAQIAAASNFAYRDIVLENNWTKKDAGIILAFTNDSKPVGCNPVGQNRYNYIYEGKKYKSLKTLSGDINPKAYQIYRPFPNKDIQKRDLLSFCMSGIHMSDVISVFVLTIILAIVSLVIPHMFVCLFDSSMGNDMHSIVPTLIIAAVLFYLGGFFFSLVRHGNYSRICAHMKEDVQNACFKRIFDLPDHVFRKYDSADFGKRTCRFGIAVSEASGCVLDLLTGIICLLIFMAGMLFFSPILSLVGLAIAFVVTVANVLLSDKIIKLKQNIEEYDSEAASDLYQYIEGVDKIHMAGVEDRAVYEYMTSMSESYILTLKKEKIEHRKNHIRFFMNSLIPIAIFVVIEIFKIELTIGEFLAFVSVLGLAGHFFNIVGSATVKVLTLRPEFERFAPILETLPETDGNKIYPGLISGRIDLDHVCFSYNAKEPVLEDISMHIEQGEYVGIVGTSGCGKSTLLKLLLGFETPMAGKIFYDDQSIDNLDIRELRRQFGVVLQDGKLIAGSILDNIRITCPDADMDRVRKVCETVDLIDDIDNMPMGIHTVLSESAETISGGQKQRILIARAIINNPQILFFDEATSALDNVSQNHVCNALEQMNCTRIVIAHRLSTIQKCDKIIVLDNGRIAEEGTYESLMAQKGLFSQLAYRQLNDNINMYE